jgi:hypothetical protein
MPIRLSRQCRTVAATESAKTAMNGPTALKDE